MPRNDRSDSLSVRGPDDPRQPLRALEQEAELELARSEAGDTGGVEHRSGAEREGPGRDARAEEHAAGASPAVKGKGLGGPGSGSDGE